MTEPQNSLGFAVKWPLAALLAAGLLVAGCGDNGAESTPADDAGTTSSTDVGNPPADSGDGGSTVGSGAALGDMALGPVDAPVTVIEYASMTCSHCASFHRTTYPRLKQNFIDTGRIRYVLREFPLNGIDLVAAALARCAGEDRYFEVMDTIFSTQEDWAFGRDPVGNLEDMAGQFGVSDDQFTVCREDETLQARLMARRTEGQNRYGVSATPTLVINGEKWEGSRAYTEIAKHLISILPPQ